MLRVYFGDHPKEIYNTSVYFNNSYQDQWLSDLFARELIRKIDCSEVVDSNVIRNSVLGSFPPTKLSGGVKTLLLLYFEPKSKIFNISTCGDNCAKYILKIAEEKDITVTLHHAMYFGKHFQLKVINEKRRKVISDPEEFLFLASEYLRGDSNARED
ncbi:MAG: DUF4869 domain-containing protein [Oscillospiraceae bacterium]|nr:DUF4869 domain-containing protein [Oscillospiraceae bacterium]